MKKSWLKKVISIGLAMIMAVGLCACGGDDDVSSGGNSGGKKDPNVALAKENVYKYQEIELPEIEGDSYNIRTSFYKDGTLYLIMQVYNWSSISNNEETKLVTMKTDGTDVKLISLETPKTVIDIEGEDEGEDGSDGVIDGGATVMPMPLPMPRAEVSDAEVETEEGTTEEDAEKVATEDIPVVENPNVWENTSYGQYALGADGKIYATKNYYYEDYGDPENYIYIQKQYVTCWDYDGSFLWETAIEGLESSEEWIYINRLLVSPDGTVTLLLTGNNTYKMQVTAEGTSEKQPVPEEVSTLFMNSGTIVSKEDGTLMVTYYDQDDWTKMYLSTYDPVTDTIGEPSQLPESFAMGGYYSLYAGYSSDLIYSTDKGIYTYNIGDAESKQKMNFINSDLNISNFNSLVELDENSFVGVFYENYGDMKMGLFTYVAPEDIPDKSVLVLAGNWIDTEMKQRVVEYNRSSEQYRIVIKQYDAYTEEEGWQAGYTQLNNDIITGNMPDILVTDGLPIENYASKGWLADIAELIAQDEVLSQVEFVQNVFDAYSMEGKLYYIIPNFNVTTMLGKSSIIGDRTSWTMADMQSIKSSLPEGTEMIGELTQGYFFNMVMQYCGSDFVDVETGKCDFNSQNFIDMMEFAKNLPEALGDDYYGEDFWMTYESRYRENKTILMGVTIGSIPNLNYTINGTFGEDVSYVGFPTMSGQGSYISAYSSYVLSSRSQHLDAAWDFMKYYLSEEYQSELTWGLPIQMKYFKENAQLATQRPFYLDENGEKVEYDDYFYMNGESIKLDPMTQEQVDEMVEFILSVDKRYYTNEEILNIINEEMGGFFSGQRTAQDVAAIIQSRVQIFVDENR